MRKIFLIIFAVICVNCFVSASLCATAQKPPISQIEEYLFGYEYKNESDLKRLDRLEDYIYGKKEKTTQQVRLTRLNNDLNMKAVAEEALAKAQSQGKTAVTETPDYLPKSDASVKYPIVDKIEQQVLAKTYTSEDIYKRVDRLEKKVFNKNMTGELNDRVDKLRVAVKIPNQNFSDDEDNFLSDKYSSDAIAKSTGMDNDNGYNYYSPSTAVPNSSMGRATGAAAPAKQAYNYNYNQNNASYDLSSIERAVLNKNYPNDTPTARLNRLESKIFGITFPQDDFDSRAQRITAAASAQKKSGFTDNTRLMKNINTGIQVGGFILMILAMFL